MRVRRDKQRIKNLFQVFDRTEQAIEGMKCVCDHAERGVAQCRSCEAVRGEPGSTSVSASNVIGMNPQSHMSRGFYLLDLVTIGSQEIM